MIICILLEGTEAMDTSEAGTSNDMDVDEGSESKKSRPNPYDEPQALALYALLDQSVTKYCPFYHSLW